MKQAEVGSATSQSPALSPHRAQSHFSQCQVPTNSAGTRITPVLALRCPSLLETPCRHRNKASTGVEGDEMGSERLWQQLLATESNTTFTGIVLRKAVRKSEKK